MSLDYSVSKAERACAADMALSADDAFVPMTPPPGSIPPGRHPRLGDCLTAWPYVGVDGVPQGFQCRFETAGGKEFRPLRYGRLGGREGWHWKGWGEGRPLYRLRELVAEPEAPVLVVEGEKAADAAALAFPDHVAVSPMNGARSPRKSDWSVVAGREVTIWPDADEPGRDFARAVARLAKDAGARSVRIVAVPDGAPEGWDLADPLPRGWTHVTIMTALAAATPVVIPANDNPAGSGVLAFDLEAWDVQARFCGKAPPERWLVSNSIPRGKPGLFVAMGDTGKSMIALELALRVAAGAFSFGHVPIFGGQVQEFGDVVILSAEDDADSIHQRLERIDPDDSRRRALRHRLRVIPLPNVGGPVSLIVQRGHEITLTAAFHELCAQMKRLQPTLVILDPLTPFCHADINADSTAAGVLGSAMAQLASETGATVIATHHMRKPTGKPVETAADARDAIRGSSALVDGVRFVYALWPEIDEKKAKAACRNVGRADDGHSVYRGAIVKANGSQARIMHTLVRNPTSGLLEQVVAETGAKRPGEEELMRELVDVIALAAEDGQPYAAAVGSLSGLHTRRATLPPSMQELSKARLAELVECLEGDGRIVRALHRGTAAKWLDVPDGPFANGSGTFAAGALTGRAGRKAANKDAAAT